LENNSGNTDTITGNPLRSLISPLGFAPRVDQNGANNFIIENAIQLGGRVGNLVLTGTGAGQVQLSGVISDAAVGASRGLSILMAGTGSYFVTGPNTFTGTSRLFDGRLILGNNTALGVGGKLEIFGGTIGSGPDANTTLKNPLSIERNFQAGALGAPKSLTFTGTTTVKAKIRSRSPTPGLR